MNRVATTLLSLILFSCSAGWQPNASIPGGFRRSVVGDPARPGPFRFQLRMPAGARVGAHYHSVAVRVKVLRGSMFIVVGEPLEASRAQRFVAGSTFVIPARAWHVEWWEEESLMEGEGVGPMETHR